MVFCPFDLLCSWKLENYSIEVSINEDSKSLVFDPQECTLKNELKYVPQTVFSILIKVLLFYKNRLVESKEFTIASFYGEIPDPDTQKHPRSFYYGI